MKRVNLARGREEKRDLQYEIGKSWVNSPGGGTEEAVLWVARRLTWLNVEATTHW